MKTKKLIPFVAITFGLTWGIAALLIRSRTRSPLFLVRLVPTNPLIILAVYLPGIVGVFLVWWHSWYIKRTS